MSECPQFFRNRKRTWLLRERKKKEKKNWIANEKNDMTSFYSFFSFSAIKKEATEFTKKLWVHTPTHTHTHTHTPIDAHGLKIQGEGPMESMQPNFLL